MGSLKNSSEIFSLSTTQLCFLGSGGTNDNPGDDLRWDGLIIGYQVLNHGLKQAKSVLVAQYTF